MFWPGFASGIRFLLRRLIWIPWEPANPIISIALGGLARGNATGARSVSAAGKLRQ
jgi:hypothetical protein